MIGNADKAIRIFKLEGIASFNKEVQVLVVLFSHHIYLYVCMKSEASPFSCSA